MKIQSFTLERYFAKHEFSVRHLLCSSDCDGMSMAELLSLADRETKMIWDSLTLGYTESQGLPALRKEITGVYKSIRPEDVLVAAPQECIFLAMNALLEAGDHIICTSPGYQSLYEIATAIGCDVSKWNPEEENGWRFNPSVLNNSLTDKTKLIVVNFPHNPTGFLPTREDFRQIIEIASANDIYLFSDEMYRGLEYDSADKLPAAVDIYGKAISLAGMSKVFGLAGLRIGWLVTRDNEALKKMILLKDYTTICPSAPSEILALIGLRTHREIIKKNLEVISKNLKLVDAFFKEYKDVFEWQRPTAGTIAFPRLLDNRSSQKFCENLIEEAEVLLLPSMLYDYGDSHVRFGFGRRSMPRALDSLSKWLKTKRRINGKN